MPHCHSLFCFLKWWTISSTTSQPSLQESKYSSSQLSAYTYLLFILLPLANHAECSLGSSCLPKIRFWAYLRASCSWNLDTTASNKNPELWINEVSVWSLKSVGGGEGETPSTPMTSEQLSSRFSGASLLQCCSLNLSIDVLMATWVIRPVVVNVLIVEHKQVLIVDHSTPKSWI